MKYKLIPIISEEVVTYAWNLLIFFYTRILLIFVCPVLNFMHG